MSYPSHPYGRQPGGQPQGTGGQFSSGGGQAGQNYGAPPKQGQQLMPGGLGGMIPAPPTQQMQGLSLHSGPGGQQQQQQQQQQWYNQQQLYGNHQMPGHRPPTSSNPSTSGQPLQTGPPLSGGVRPGMPPPGGHSQLMKGGLNGQPSHTSLGGPPTLLGGPPTSLGGPPTSLGGPPTSLGGPPTSLGGPPRTLGGLPTSLGGPPTSLGGPPTSLGGPPTSIGGPPTSIRPPSSMGLQGVPPTGQPPVHGVPPTSQPPVHGVPPTSQPLVHGVPPTSQPPVHGAPPTSQPPVHGVPPTSQPPVHGVPPTSQPPVHGVPPTSQPPVHGIPPTSQPLVPPSNLTGPPTSLVGPPPPSGMIGPPQGSLSMRTGVQHSGTTVSGSSLTGPPAQEIHRGPGPPPGMGTVSTQGPPMGPPGGPQVMSNQPNLTAYPGQHQSSVGPSPSLAGPPPPTFQGPLTSQLRGTHPTGPMGMPNQPGIAPLQAQQQLPEELRPCNLLETRNILPSEPLVQPPIKLPGDYSRFQPDPNIISSTLNVVPVTQSLLSKMKLPFGIHIHPYRQHSSKIIPVLHPSVIVRCRVCRTYINPFVTFIDSRHWRCNLCFRPNDLPEDFNYNPTTGDQGRQHRKELVYTSVEYIASSEYMLRPPQPCTYYFVIDVSHNAVTSGMLATVCATLLENLDRLPGDSRTLFGLMTFDRNLHVYNVQSNLAQFQMMVVSDLDDVFLPIPGSLLVNLRESKEMIKNILEELPKMFANNPWIDSALGAALTAACKVLSTVGGRISVFTATTPSVGPGATKQSLAAETKSSVSKEKLKIAPTTDFYKKIALDCYTQQTGIDLFLFSQQPIGYASIACAAQVSSGQVYYYPGFHSNDAATRDRFVTDLTRYLTRPIGFEAVMRIRCTQGLGLHAFHGNFFVRSSDLLSLPNVSPDMAYAVNLSIDESLKDLQVVCVQTALLYTTYKGERRIRVHTIALPVSDKAADIYAGCNVQAMTCLLAKMAADKVSGASLGDAREALMNAVVDCIKAYKSNMHSSGFLCLPASLRLFPLFTFSLMKHPAFSFDSRTTVDSRADAMNSVKTLPLDALMVHIYPHLCCITGLTEENHLKETKSGTIVIPERLHNTAAKLQRSEIFLVDSGSEIMIWVGQGCSPEHLHQLFGIGTYPDVDDTVHALTQLDTPLSKMVTTLIKQLKRIQPKTPRVRIVKEQSSTRFLMADRLVEDRTEAAFSYQEFLQHLEKQFKK